MKTPSTEAGSLRALSDAQIERLAAEFIAEDWEPDRYYRNMNLVAFVRAALSHLAVASKVAGKTPEDSSAGLSAEIARMKADLVRECMERLGPRTARSDARVVLPEWELEEKLQEAYERGRSDAFAEPQE